MLLLGGLSKDIVGPWAIWANACGLIDASDALPILGGANKTRHGDQFGTSDSGREITAATTADPLTRINSVG